MKIKNKEIKISTSKITKLDKEHERIEQKYTPKLDSIINQVKENEENLTCISKDRQLEKKKCEVEIDSLKESIKPDLSNFFDLYHWNTRSFILYLIIIMLFILSQNSLY